MYTYSTFEEESRKRKIKGRVLQILEFDRIIEKLSTYTSTAYGLPVAQELVPTTDEDEVKRTLDETDEAFIYINKYGPLPLSGFPDVRHQLSYADAGGVMSMKELLDIAVFLESTDRLKKVVSGEHADLYETSLFKNIELLDKAGKLSTEIRACICNENEMNDRASDTLYRIRQEKKDVQQNIRVMLDRIIRTHEDSLQEALVTIRGDRYCVPVKAEFKNRIPGIVHDQSSTGQTVFIEPMAVVEANNRIRELQAEENVEIERILTFLTEAAKRAEKTIRSDAEIIGIIDFNSAKAHLAIHMDAAKPAVSNTGSVRLVKARHPLIDPKQVVPVDIEVGDKYKTLIITGPNTGGKTVSLKTCGLLTMMAMAGLMIPAATGSEVTVFDRVLAAIGDEQSIEQSLSTFSAQMSNIVFILKNIRGKSLVLLDELGSGTDPAEGAALAIAVLDELYSRDCTVMATTHYKELKAYAIEKDGVMNASCEFNTETLSPTYKLIIGMPGVSNAFVISKKLGLPARIIDEAIGKLSDDELAYERLLADAEKKNREAQALLEENKRLKQAAEEEKNALEAERKALKASKTKILNDMRAEQKALLEDKSEELDRLIKDAKRSKGRQDKAEREQELEKIRRRLRAGVKDLAADDESEAVDLASLPGEPPKTVKIGDLLVVPSMGVTGTAISEVSRSGKVKIAANGMSFEVKLDQLRVPDHKQVVAANEKDLKKKTPRDRVVEHKNQSVTDIKMHKVSTTMPELMLLGKRYDEAERMLDAYLDDCSLSGIKEVRIVHGKGTGALRSMVDEFLRGDSRVASFRLGIVGEGDDGVTIAKLY